MRERWRCPRVVLRQVSHSKVTRLDWTPKFSVHCSFAVFACLNARLPMWPSPRLPWPSSVCVRCFGGSGSQRFRGGGSRGTYLPRRWSKGFNQCHGTRPGLVTGSRRGRQTVRSRRRRVDPVPRRRDIGQVLRPDQVQHSKSREGGRSARTLNWQGKEGGPGSSSSQERSEDGGLPRQRVS